MLNALQRCFLRSRYAGKMRRCKKRITGLVRNCENLLKYDWGPLAGEEIIIYPSRVENTMSHFPTSKKPDLRAVVIDSPWPWECVSPVSELYQVEAVRLRFIDGLSWEKTGVYQYVLDLINKKGAPVAGCKTYEDVVARYNQLDNVFEVIKREGRVRSEYEINLIGENKDGDRFFDVGPTGEVYFIGSGWHRFAMAQILDIPYPAQVRFVHVDGIRHLDRFRSETSDFTQQQRRQAI